MTDNAPIAEQGGETKWRPFGAFLAALQFLTIIPPIIRRPFTTEELGRSVGFYPLVGLLIGSLLLAADYLLSLLLPVPVRSALLLALWVLLTGALHLDGFLDACDGLLGGHTPASRLQIMRDERVGAYALGGGILLLLIKFTTLNALVRQPAALLLPPTLGRWGISLALVAYPYAREQGLGRAIKDNAGWRQVLLATLTALVVCWFAGGWTGMLLMGAAGLVAWGASTYTLRRIPGLTGDIYGAINELIEIIILLGLVIAQGA